MNMKYFKYKHLFTLIGGLLILLTSCTKDLTDVTIVYENNFNNGDPKGIVTAGWLSDFAFGVFPFNKITNYKNLKMLGVFNNTRIELDVDKLPEHSVLKVEFDLYLHDSWKNDLWMLSIDGNNRLLTGFSNISSIQQAYPNWLNSGPTFPAGNQAQEIYLPGLCSLKDNKTGTSKYKIVHSLLHSAKTVKITMSDAGGNKNDTCARSWAIDNLKVVALKN
jgi:hypothetical protein